MVYVELECTLKIEGDPNMSTYRYHHNVFSVSSITRIVRAITRCVCIGFVAVTIASITMVRQETQKFSA